MQKHFDNSDAAYPIGLPSGKKIFKVSSGQYAGRILILMFDYESSSNEAELSYAYADYPYNSWSSLVSITADIHDSVVDAIMDSSGHVYLVYTDSINEYIVFRKLNFTSGTWNIDSTVTIYSGAIGYYPSVVSDPNGRLYVAWSSLIDNQYSINIKYSDDDGVTWGSGPGDGGVNLISGASLAFAKLLILAGHIYAVYTRGGTILAYRRKSLDGTNWDSEVEIADSTGLDEHFDAAISGDGRIGLVFNDGAVKYREFDGEKWGALAVVDEDGGYFPQVSFYYNIPYLVYASDFGPGQRRPVFTYRDGLSFVIPTLLDSRRRTFEKVLCYSMQFGTYADITDAAQSEIEADVYHTATSTMLRDLNDALCLGLAEKFNYLRIKLATPGIGGEINWQYFDGQVWKSFLPFDGQYNFSAGDKKLWLWQDYLSIPGDWQKCVINGDSLYWVRATVITLYTTGVVGSQITAVPETAGLIIME
jgi:hypothetical protein